MQKTVHPFSLQQFLWGWLCRWFCCWFSPMLFICWSTWNLLTGTTNAKLLLPILHKWKTVTWGMRKSHWEVVEMNRMNLEASSFVKSISSSVHLSQWNSESGIFFSTGLVLCSLCKFFTNERKIGSRLFIQFILLLIDSHLKVSFENRTRKKDSSVSNRYNVIGVYSCSTKPKCISLQPAYQVLKRRITNGFFFLKLNKETKIKKKIIISWLILTESESFPGFVIASTVLLCIPTK